jgi:asparagine N-glycosylation enzyme membrane subunit Stt3
LERGYELIVLPTNQDIQSEKSSEEVKNRYCKFIWIIPAVVAFLIALIPTITNQWPLTVDIFVHVRAAEVFSHYGFTFVDPMINPPRGAVELYPPLFSLVLVFLGSIFKINYFIVARILQPFLAFFVVLSVSYVAKKFYGNIAGISAGFLVMSSYLFTRLVSPLPETMAIIFVPLIVYLYYQSVVTKKYKYALMASFLFLIVLLTHQSTTSLLFLIITSITIVVGILKRDRIYLISYALFLSIPLISALILAAVAFLLFPSLAHKILTYAITLIKTSVPYNDPISNSKYLVYLGIVLIFMIIGSIQAVKRRATKDLFLIVWVIVIFLMSKSYWFGVNVYTIRFLVHLLLPLSILGGMGLSYLYLNYKKKEFPSKSIRTIFLVSIFVISTLFALVTVTESNFQVIPQYNTQPYGSTHLVVPQLAPPTISDEELANWFNQYGDNKSTVVSNDYETNLFLVSTTNQAIANVQSSTHIIERGFNTTELAQKKVGYFVLDKRLTFSNINQKTIVSGFIYYNTNYNVTSSLPANAQLVYQNQYYDVYKI